MGLVSGFGYVRVGLLGRGGMVMTAGAGGPESRLRTGGSSVAAQRLHPTASAGAAAVLGQRKGSAAADSGVRDESHSALQREPGHRIAPPLAAMT